MSVARTKYIIITPARDEGEFLEKTIASVAEQTLLSAAMDHRE